MAGFKHTKAQLSGRMKPTKVKKQDATQKRKRADVSREKLAQSITDLDPKGDYKTFDDLPLSDETRAGLKANNFADLTDIQSKAIATALKGSDILGAAKTGSGKTLAFLIPVLENLYRNDCIGPDAGLGAMIISPTRELAVQIFDVMRKIGSKGHMFSAGLVIGGKSLQEEQDALARMNIVVCTPGRMLQHLSQTAYLSVDMLQMLILDEADRILDMGFQKDVDAIMEYLPSSRQSMLFSATQSKKVSDLARLSLRDPEYIAVHEKSAAATPENLVQNYTLIPLDAKIDTLWSFLQSSKRSKIIVFLSSGKEVRFYHESFRKMQPGIPLLHLHGRQKQTQRQEITSRFAAAKFSCLFATDIAARGLDFPKVDFIIQVDCPEDADTYIHRVGRTARYGANGRAVLFLEPSEEEGMLQRLEHKKVPIERVNVRPKKQQSIRDQLQNICYKDPQLKYLGQKAFVSYVRSVYLQKDKEIFKLKQLPLEDFAASLGLAGAPRIKFAKGDDAKALKNAPRQRYESPEEEEQDPDDVDGAVKAKPKKQDNVRTKYDRMFERQNQDVLTNHYNKLVRDEGGQDKQIENGDSKDDVDESDDDFMGVKRRIEVDEEAAGSEVNDDSAEEDSAKVVRLPGAKEGLILDSKRREKLLKSKKKLLKLREKGTKMVFDDEGNAHPIYELGDEGQFMKEGLPEEQRQKFLDEEAIKVREADAEDRLEAKKRRREKKQRAKDFERLQAEAKARRESGEDGVDEDGETGVAVLANDSGTALKDFLADAELSDRDEAGKDDLEQHPRQEQQAQSTGSANGEDVEEQPHRKRKKMKTVRQVNLVDEHPETLEDLEALASGLLT